MFRGEVSLDPLIAKYAEEGITQFVEIDGLRIHYRAVGQGEPLLLLHDLNTTALDWTPWEASLSSHYRVITFDMPGFGLSTAPAPTASLRTDDYIYFVKKVVATLKLQQFYIGGVGWGADLAWHYTLLHPYLVKRLVLLSPTDYPDYKAPFAHRLGRHFLGRVLYRWLGSAAIVKRRAQKALAQPQELLTPTLVQRWLDMLTREGHRSTMIRTLRAVRRSRFTRLPALETPTLLIGGEEPHPIAAHLPVVKVVALTAVKQYPMLESPAQSAQAVLQFLDA